MITESKEFSQYLVVLKGEWKQFQPKCIIREVLDLDYRADLKKFIKVFVWVLVV